MKYIGFYDRELNRRAMCLAATNKMDYICEAINRADEKVTIVSCGMITEEVIAESEEIISDSITVKYFKTSKQSKNKLKRIYNVFMQNIRLFLYLMKNVSANEKIMVYHSLALMRCLYIAKKFKGFKMILEVEEFYNDVKLKSSASKSMEKKFIECADAYIFPTKLLNEKFNKHNKPYIIIHGTYKIEEDRNVSFQDGKIHVVYAGTFDPRKGGVTAAATAEFLPENYHIHIIGFGSDKEIENIRNVVTETNKKSESTVTYDGLLSGEDYIQFLQKCQIGLSPQNPNADFNATSFPSKILSYMSNGLRVVTIRIPAIEISDIGNDVYYYDKQEPEEIAKVIMSIDFNDGYDGRERIKELDKRFKTELKELIRK